MKGHPDFHGKEDEEVCMVICSERLVECGEVAWLTAVGTVILVQDQLSQGYVKRVCTTETEKLKKLDIANVETVAMPKIEE